MKAHEIQMSLIKANRAVDAVGIDSAMTCNNLGLVNCRLGDYKNAIECFNDATELQIRLSDSAREVRRKFAEPGDHHSNLAELTNVDRHAVAEKNYLCAIQVQSKLVKLNPANWIYRSDLANTHTTSDAEGQTG